MLRGEVWLTNLDPTIGPEIRKRRPSIIVSSDAVGVLPLRVIVPLTDWKERYSAAAWMVRITPSAANGISKVSAADTFQVRSVAQERLVKKLGRLSETEMQAIAGALAIVLVIK